MITEDVYKEMKALIAEFENKQPTQEKVNGAYIEVISVKRKYKYNPAFGDDKLCKCGHSYYRHFDTYEKMDNVGCKYCGCHHFEEAEKV